MKTNACHGTGNTGKYGTHKKLKRKQNKKYTGTDKRETQPHLKNNTPTHTETPNPLNNTQTKTNAFLSEGKEGKGDKTQNPKYLTGKGTERQRQNRKKNRLPHTQTADQSPRGRESEK